MCHNRSISYAKATVKPKPDVPDYMHLGLDMPSGAVCKLKAVVDHTFYNDVAGGDDNVAVSVVTQHIAVADFVFRTTDMVELDALPDNIGFSIGEVRIYRSPASLDYRLGDTSVHRDKLMTQFSSYNFNAFCLAVAFTYRNLGQLLDC